MKNKLPLLTGWILLATASLGWKPAAPGGLGPAAARPRSVLTKVVRGRDVKVLVDAAHRDALSKLKSATRLAYDYGAFSLLVLDEEAAGGRDRLASMGLVVRDDLDVVRLDSLPIAAADPERLLGALDPSLRNDRVRRAFEKGGAPTEGLYLVQLVGPVKDEWRRALEDEGLSIVSYLPEDTYVVWARAEAAGFLPRLLSKLEFVQLVVDYEPAFKIAPELRGAAPGREIRAIVQVAKHPGYKRTVEALGRLAKTVRLTSDAGAYVNVLLAVDSAKVAEIARIDDVFSIGPSTDRRKLDEVQGQIVAGNITGNLPTGPGYLSWLDARGFTSSQFQSFVVNVVDDSHQLTGTAQHPDLPASRVVFQNNPTNGPATQDGHGFLNAHIIGGFNNSTGTAYEDVNFYNYGLGISPYARMGVTDVFGAGAATATNWESTAYTSGSRISSNSWGYSGLFRYNADAQEYDRIVRDAQTATGLQQLIVVFAAGNDGPNANTVSTPATAKNVITVGASESVRQTGTDGCAVNNAGADNCNDLINFSSRGPVNSTGGDGRIKPDIVAPGTHIEAGIPQSGAAYDGTGVCNRYWPTNQTLYGWSSGTSHSCPAVAAGASLVYQDFLNQGRAAPSPAMVKAMLMGSAARMTGAGANDTLPSNTQGMGRMDLGRALDRVSRMFVDQTTILGATGESYQTTGAIADSTQPFRVTLVWTDAPGPTTGAPWVNNLDLQVTINGTTYLGNVMSGGVSIPGGTAATRDNAESVFLPAGTTGTFSVTVLASNIAGDGVPGNSDTTDQDFALVIYNAAPAPTIGVSPASMTFDGTAGGASPAPASLALSNTGGGLLAWTARTDRSWLSVTASGTAPSTLTVTADLTGLAAGTYTGDVIITGTGATNSPVTVPVTLTVAEAPPTIGLSSASLSFTGTAGAANPADQTLAVSNTGGGALSFSASSSAAWLTVSPASGTAPSTLTASVDLAGLAAGSYSASITISGTGASNSPVTVPVTLTVAEPPPTISLSSASLSFSGTAGAASPAAQTLTLSNSGGGTLAFSASSSASWLTVSPSSGTAPATLTAAVDLAGLAAGSYSASITIGGTGATNTPAAVAVTLTVAEPPPTISVSSASLSFRGAAGGASPAAQSFTLSNVGGGTLVYSASSSASWLTVSPSSGTAPATLAAAVNLAGLAAGTYNGSITILGTGATNTPVAVPVTLTVTPPVALELLSNGGFEGSISPWVRGNAAAFYTSNGANAHGGTGYAYVGAIDNASGAVIQVVTIPAGYTTATLSYWMMMSSVETASWTADRFYVEIASNTNGATLATVAALSNRDAASYATYQQRTFDMTPFIGQTVRVQFRAITNASLATTLYVDDVSLLGTQAIIAPPSIAVSAASLAFSGTAGGTGPAGQALSITNSGGGTLAWTATTDQAWLSLGASSGTAPSSLTASVNTTGLAAGTYSANITIASTGAANSPRTIPVTLTVAPPVGVEILSNGGFEGGSSSPWIRGNAAALYGTTSGLAHGGSGYVYLGSIDGASGAVIQVLTIPATYRTATLSFWLMMTSSETASWAADRFYVEVVSNTNGATLATLASYSNLNASSYTSYVQRNFDMTPFIGQNVRVQFRAITNASLPTTFYVDDASILAQ